MLVLAWLALVPTPSAAAPERAPALRAGRPGAAALDAARRFLCPHGGAPVRGRRGRCAPGTGSSGAVAAGGAAGWDAGLPPPARLQAPCPEGTIAVAARDRPEATRCLPR